MALTLAAISSAQGSVVGKWRAEGVSFPKGFRSIFVFTKDRVNVRTQGENQPGRPMAFNLLGTYKLRGSNLIIKLADARLDPSVMTAADRAKITPQMQTGFKKMILARPVPSGTIRFQSKDRFTVFYKSGETSTFFRVR